MFSLKEDSPHKNGRVSNAPCTYMMHGTRCRVYVFYAFELIGAKAATTSLPLCIEKLQYVLMMLLFSHRESLVISPMGPSLTSSRLR